MSLITPEVSGVLTPALIGLMLTLTGCIGAWLRMKTKQWEKMTEETREFAKESVALTDQNRKILEKNTEISRDIRLQGEATRGELQTIAAAAAFKAGVVKGMLESTGRISDKDIELMEKSFNDSISENKPK